MDTYHRALSSADTLLATAKRGIGDGEDQFAAHGYAWMATYVAGLRQMLGWAERLQADGQLGELEGLMVKAAFGEYLAQMQGGIPLSQVEIVRPHDLGVDEDALQEFRGDAVRELIHEGNSPAVRQQIADLIFDGHFGARGLGDETLEMIADQFHRFADEEVAPFAQAWHQQDQLIPIKVVDQMAELGVFGLTIAEDWGGLGMGKMAMCVVTEELSRGYLGVGSLGTRSEIAGELIGLGGTDEQKQTLLPKIASGEILPTAVFTEPNTGSDLASLRTKAVKTNGAYTITGAKTWITHAARSDLMTLLVRTDPDTPGYKGLSMLLAEKPRGNEDDPFPAPGMSGTEIEVLGYRGMKEFELAFDGFQVPEAALLGATEGQGFKQLMATFEA
ncbi:MAG: acyl-CoA dehydrogenase, partial [Alphaproteobacteria bacterium]|nr:acyl-CoA dehydrogenase [Alphaproteobacteria bacterium]